MGRTRSFDESQAITAARAVFSERGYEGTSVDILVAATGVHRGSLYGTFGSKRGLFMRCLEQAIAEPGESDDLVLVAVFDLAPRDPEIRERLSDCLPGKAALGARLLARAGLSPDPSARSKE